jgi:hypothetical protein
MVDDTKIMEDEVETLSRYIHFDFFFGLLLINDSNLLSIL